MVVDSILVISLVLLAGLFVVVPVMMNRSDAQVSRRRSNVTLYQERIADLQAEQAAGAISAEEFAQLETELQHRLLEDNTPNLAATDLHSPSEPSGFKRLPLKQTLLISVLMGVFAIGFYHQNGAISDWQITRTLQSIQAAQLQSQQQPQSQQHAANMAAMAQTLLKQLRSRLQQQPKNSQYLMLLAATETSLGNYPAATAAYDRLAQKYPEDASILAQYAQSLYLASGRKLTDTARSNAQRALAIDPVQPTALGLMGIASYEARDYRSAIDYWQRLLPALGPVSPNRNMIESGIAKAKSMLAPGQQPAASAPRLLLNVAIADHVQVDPAASVFVYARAQSGPKIPLAVARLKAADLPTQVVLDESMAMAPGMSLSSYSQVEVIARISTQGLANRGSGDIEGSVSHIDVAAATEVIDVLIADIVP